MDKFVVKGDEWHYRLLLFFGASDWGIQYEYKNFCTYWRAVMLCSLLCLVISSIAITIVFGLLYAPVYMLLLHPFYGWISERDTFWVAITIFDGIALLLVAIVWLWWKYDWGVKISNFTFNLGLFIDRLRTARRKRKWAKEEEEEKPKQLGFFRQWLTTIRDKTCVAIEFEKRE